MRDKNPKIPADAIAYYQRDVTITDLGVERSLCIDYSACLIDSEDIVLLNVTVDGHGASMSELAVVQAWLDEVHSTLRAELAEYADYVDAHRGND